MKILKNIVTSCVILKNMLSITVLEKMFLQVMYSMFGPNL